MSKVTGVTDSTWCQEHKRKKIPNLSREYGASPLVCNVCEYLAKLEERKESADAHS